MFEDCKVELLETFGNDLTVVNAARVSLGKHADEFTEKDGKLIKYLADHEHTSPFFHPQLRFRLKMPIWMADPTQHNLLACHVNNNSNTKSCTNRHVEMSITCVGVC
jgi:hypothetical protein